MKLNSNHTICHALAMTMHCSLPLLKLMTTVFIVVTILNSSADLNHESGVFLVPVSSTPVRPIGVTARSGY